jgi:hypothetical protein
MLKDWGCDLLLFFSYNRINAAIDNPLFEEHLNSLLGKERLSELRQKLKDRSPGERESLILESFTEALKGMGFEYVLPFTFRRPDMNRTSHHLIFVTKHPLAYSVMKEIMAKESSEFNQGVASFTYTKALSAEETPLLYLLERPLEDLAGDLLKRFAGQTLTMDEVFERHHIGTPYIKKNYKAALLDLEEQGKISTNPAASNRRKRAGKPTFAGDVMIEFPNATKS